MKLDILVFASHPDDAELGCSGTIAKHVAQGYKVGIVDITQGELGTRGTVELRDAVRLELGREPVAADGAILIERPEILYWQVVSP